jgi:NDP-sugar pyrophosphorylase family protein
MQAVILAGGQGTRLRPYTVTLPKPLVPVGTMPVLEIVLLWMRRAGVTRVTLAVNHLAELIMAFFGNGSKLGIELEYAVESEPLGTIGPLRMLTGLDENFLVMNGDVLTDLDLRAFWERHVRSAATLTVATHARSASIDYGVIETDRGGRVASFREKPQLPFKVSMGIYAMHRRVLEFVPPAGAFGFDGLVHAMLAKRAPIDTVTHDGFWMDIGRPEDYEKVVELGDDLYRRLQLER